MRTLVTTLSLLLFGLPLQAQVLTVNTHYGEQHVEIVLSQEKAQKTWTIKSPLATRELKAKDAEFLIREFKKLPVVKRVPASCDRARIDLVLTGADGKKQKRSSCFGEKTQNSDRFVRFSNILMLAL